MPELCDDFLDQKLPVDHSRLAQSLLQLIVKGGGQPAAHSVHVLREGLEIGCWSLDREGIEVVIAVARELDERKPRPSPKLRLVHSSSR